MRTQKLRLTFSTDTHIYILLKLRPALPCRLSQSRHRYTHIVHSESGWNLRCAFLNKQHNRCENAFRPASSTRNDGASAEAGAREPAIRFRGNDTPSALIRRPGECEGDWGGVPTKGEREDTSSSSKNEGVENAKKGYGHHWRVSRPCGRLQKLTGGHEATAKTDPHPGNRSTVANQASAPTFLKMSANSEYNTGTLRNGIENTL